MGYGFDRLLYPVEVKAGANTIVEGGLEYDVAPGVYYHRAESSDTDLEDRLSDYPSLFEAIDEALTEVNLYNWQWWAPDGYDHEESLSITGDSSWSLDFAASAFDFPPEYLGFPPDQNETVTSEMVIEGVHIIGGSRSVYGMWIAAPMNTVKASDKTSHLETEAYASTDPIYERTKLITMREHREPRVLSWENVPGLRIHGGTVRGEQQAYRELAGVPEATDGFEQEGKAVALRSVYQSVVDRDFLVFYDLDDRTETEPPAGAWEALRIGDLSAVESMEEWFDRQNDGGEICDVLIPTLVVDSDWDY